MTWMTCKGLSVRIISTRAGGDRGHIRQASTFLLLLRVPAAYLKSLAEVRGQMIGIDCGYCQSGRLATKLKC